MRILPMVLALAWTAVAQEFEVASVKPHVGPSQRMGLEMTGNRLEDSAQSLYGLVMDAYHLRNFQVAFAKGLKFDENERFDVDARAAGAGPHTQGELRGMLRNLLTRRFGLATHLEQREMRVFALVGEKGGARLTASTGASVQQLVLRRVGGNQEVNLQRADLDDIAAAIENAFFLDRPVVNRTGLTGLYDVRLEATPESWIGRADDPAEVSVLTAIRKLGLRLVPRMEKVEVLVIDGFRQPDAN